MKRDRSWPEVRADLNAAAMGTLLGVTEDRLAGVIMDLTTRVDREATAFVAACEDAEEILTRARVSVQMFQQGDQGKPGINTLGILQGRNGEIDRAALRLEESLALALRLAYVVGVPTQIDE